MALALMCREYLPENGTTLHALVVDHGLRSSSHDEATRVKHSLMKRLSMFFNNISHYILFLILLDIGAHILPIRLHDSPMKATNVETSARKMRYQALGKACRGLNCSHLLVGHHYDDQAETVLMRLVGGHTAMLRAIRNVANIPECHGLYGISESGSYTPFSPSLLPLSCGVAGIERGGIQIGRPLLDFSKSRLLATCRKFELPWFEDETNKDRTLTPRNAVRYIMEKFRLPEALRSKTLVALGRRKKQAKDEEMKFVNRLFDEMPLTLDLRSSVVTVQFPELNLKTTNEALSLDMSDSRSANNIAHMLIQRVVSIMSPGFRARTGQFNHIANHICRERSSTSKSTSLTQSSVSTINHWPRTVELSGIGFQNVQELQDVDVFTKWRLYHARKPQKIEISSSGPQPSHVFHRIPPVSKLTSKLDCSFFLWDNRYWFRVYNPAEHDLWVRTLDGNCLSSLRALLSGGKALLRSTRGDKEIIQRAGRYLDELLRETAKGKIRWSLPVIVSYTSLMITGGHDDNAQLLTPYILAFPTLGLRVEPADDVVAPDWLKDLHWEARYGKIYLGNKRLEECIVGYGPQPSSGVEEPGA